MLKLTSTSQLVICGSSYEFKSLYKYLKSLIKNFPEKLI